MRSLNVHLLLKMELKYRGKHMSKSAKIKSLLALKDVKSADYVKVLGLARQQALTTKYARESFTSDDLIKLAELTGTTLAFNDKETGKPLIEFDLSDIQK